MSLTPDEEWSWHAFVRGWSKEDAVVSKYAGTIPISKALLMDSLSYMATHPWAYPDPNPFPRFRLFRFWR